MKTKSFKIIMLGAASCLAIGAGTVVAANKESVADKANATSSYSITCWGGGTNKLTGIADASSTKTYTYKTPRGYSVGFKGYGVYTIGNVFYAASSSLSGQYFYNTTPFKSITSITFSGSFGTGTEVKVYWGTSQNPTSSSATVNAACTLNATSGSRYFTISPVFNTGVITITLEKMVINYTC